MRYSSKLTVATHILMCIDYFQGKEKVTSEFIAGSVNVNPVIVRNILGQLKRAGIVKVAAGVGGASLALDTAEISLLDVYKSVESNTDLFRFHDNPNPQCPVGRSIHPILGQHLKDVQKGMEQQLARISLKDLMDDLRR